MIVPSRRTLGAAALIAAGIGAFLVPFLLHSPSTQGTSPTPTTPGSGDKNPTTPSGSSGGDNSGNGGSCGEGKTHDPNPHDKRKSKNKGNALGDVKKKTDTTIAFMKYMGKSKPTFHFYHDTDNHNNKT